MKFTVLKKSSRSSARLGLLETTHGTIETPAFIPVGTQATVKGITKAMLEEIGFEIILANAYHLYLRPGEQIIEAAGGLHQFMSWPRPILTDSGGYQIFSLARLVRVNDEGVLFKSHLNGAEHFLTPEKILKFQKVLGADIMMPLDECLPYPVEYSQAKESVELTGRWAKRSQKYFSESNFSNQGLFGIIQGSIFSDLRKISAELTVALNFDGYALGGLSVGEPVELMNQIVAELKPVLPEEKPRYLMGVGSEKEIRVAIENGIDLFDSVLPTRLGRHGNFFVDGGRENIRNAKFAKEKKPLVKNCGCYTCQNFSVMYLRHLFMSHEIIGPVLLSVHNLRYIKNFIEEIKKEIKNSSEAKI